MQGAFQVPASDLQQLLLREWLLFICNSLIAIGIVSAAFTFLRRKYSPLLLWFSLFALLYGVRMWIGLNLVQMMYPDSELCLRLRAGVGYLVAIPAFFYAVAAGFVSGYGRKIATALSILFFALFVATMVFGINPWFEHINNVTLIVTLVSLAVVSFRRVAPDRDYIILRRGLVIFVAFILFENIGNLLGYSPGVELYGCLIFLVHLGYVAARSTLQRDQQLAEIQKELDVARRIQMGNLPAPYTDSASFRVAARYVPMTAVAGDFYDFVVADDTQAGILVADVSGHGVPAALIASMVKLAAAAQRANADDPAALLAGMNAALCGNTHNQFVTAAYVHLNAASGRLRYSAAAHPPLLLLRDGEVMEIEENGLLLAVFPFAAFSTAELPLQSGDRLVLYTDGIIEAADDRDEEFGQARLQAVLRDGAHLPAQEIADRILHSVQSWSKSQNDDLTILICDYTAVA